jgi:arabinogalactan endo-1,4-beta-galactosidase
MGLEDFEGEADYHGTKMFWSHFDKKTNLELLKKAGFELVWQKEWANPKDANDRHLFVLCRK